MLIFGNFCKELYCRKKYVTIFLPFPYTFLWDLNYSQNLHKIIGLQCSEYIINNVVRGSDMWYDMILVVNVYKMMKNKPTFKQAIYLVLLFITCEVAKSVSKCANCNMLWLKRDFVFIIEISFKCHSLFMCQKLWKLVGSRQGYFNTNRAYFFGPPSIFPLYFVVVLNSHVILCALCCIWSVFEQSSVWF